MEQFEYNEKNISKYNRWTLMIAECINNVGQKYNGKNGNELGLKGFVLLDILKRIYYNLNGLSALYKEFEKFPEIRCSLNLVFRGILSDILTGLYLAIFSEDEVSFENEVKILDLDFADFAKFIIENEALMIGKIQIENSEEYIEQYKQAYIEGNEELFISGRGWKLKSPSEIRVSSKSMYFPNDKSKKQRITDSSKYRRIKPNPLCISYLLYRYFSQYQHYSFKGRKTLSFPVTYDMQKYYVSIMMINESVHVLCKLIGVNFKELELLRKVNDESIIK